MKDRLTTYERRESIKLLLVREKSTTTRYLVNMFGVTKQTILNDIVFLSSRLPISTKAGNGGGIFLNMKFEDPREFLNDEEEQLLLYISKSLSEKEKLIISNIINKFSHKRDS